MIEIYCKYKDEFEKAGLSTKKRIACFLAQIKHESNFKPVSENLKYSTKGLLRVFSKYFTKEEVELFAFKPEKIANRVYANRMGNGSESSGDGWKFRGRGFIQLTGKENYKNFSKAYGIDAVNNPDLLLLEEYALKSALWYWNMKGLNKYADELDVKEITRRINGGYHGIDQRKEYTRNFLNIL